jgi:hypothetical protein
MGYISRDRGKRVMVADTLNIFGRGLGATFKDSGNLNVQVSSAGINPGGTAADNVLASFLLPANCLDLVGRGLYVTASGSFAATGNNKTIKLLWNPATATVGSTVGAGSSLICSTGVTAQNGGGWLVSGQVFKYGAASHQILMNTGTAVGTTHQGTAAPVLATADETTAIWIAVTGNAATAATDIVFNFLMIDAMN